MKVHALVNESPLAKLILGLILFCLTLLFTIHLSYTSSYYPEKVNYVGIFSPEPENTEYYIGVYPIIERKTLGIVISRWGDYHNQSRSIIVIPHDAENISFLQMNERKGTMYPDKIAESTDTVRVPYEQYENLTLAKEKNGVLIVKPDYVDRYYGIEFYAPGWIHQTSPSQFSIVIPLYAAGTNISPGVHQINSYRIHVSIPKNYELTDSIPTPSRFKVTGNNLAVYQFEMNATDNDLMLQLENRLMTRDNNNLKVLLGVILGSSMMFAISMAIELIMKKEE